MADDSPKIRENLVKAACRTGLKLELAMGEHKRSRKNLTDDERWAVDIAIPATMARWYRRGAPESGPEEFLEEELASAWEHVRARRGEKAENDR